MRAHRTSLLLALLVQPLGAQGLPSDGRLRAVSKTSALEGGFAGSLADGDGLGRSVTALGDLDGDGRPELAVGAPTDGPGRRGAVWILFLRPDGTVRREVKIGEGAGGFAEALHDDDRFGTSLAPLGDLDRDGTPDLAVGVTGDDDGGVVSPQGRGAVWILFLRPDGTVGRQQKISETRGGLGEGLSVNAHFGVGMDDLGDLDGDGILDLAVGAFAHEGRGSQGGSVFVLFLRRDGRVRASQRIASGRGGFQGSVNPGTSFGYGVATLGDVDGDGVPDLAVGQERGDPTASSRGAVWVLFLDTDGTVKAERKLTVATGGFTGALDDGDVFGNTLVGPGDLDLDGVPDLIAGATGDDDGGTGCGTPPACDAGALWVLFLRADGTVREHKELGRADEPLLAAALDDGDLLGSGLGWLPDTDGDGLGAILAGAIGDDDGGPERGALWTLHLACGREGRVTVREGSGKNPTGFASLSSPVIGATWRARVALPTPRARSIVLLSARPLTGVDLPLGELLCAPPFLAKSHGRGEHALLLPHDCRLLGTTLQAQALTLGGGRPRLLNALELAPGTF